MKIRDIASSPVDRWTTLVYRRKFASLERLNLRGKFFIVGPGKIYARRLTISAPHYPVGLFVDKDAEIRFGNVFLNQGVGIASMSSVSIGDDTIIGERTEIMDNDWHGFDGNPPKILPVKIGKHVWVGFRCILLKGIEIGDFSIVGAGSVVTRSVPPNTIVAGNPARKIGETRTGYTGAPQKG